MLPSRPDAPPRTTDAGAERAAGGSLRVLIVEDHPDAAESLAMLLALRGHTVRVAHDGLAAVAVLEEFAPDVALIDLGLPGIDGFEVARRLRAHPAGATARLVALSGSSRDQDRQRARGAGFDQQVTKPLDTATLNRVLAAEGDAPSAPEA